MAVGNGIKRIGGSCMFFIGIFGVEQKSKLISTNQNIVCPACGAYGRYDIIKTYNYFHVFFLPLFKWNNRYFIHTYCCNKICHLDYEIGSKIENGEQIDIKAEHVHCNSFYNNYKFCPHCSVQVDPTFQYCPYCGSRI